MQRWLPALMMVVLLTGFRILGGAMSATLPNFQPLPAFLLCGIVFLSGSQKWLVPLTVWFITDPLTSHLQHQPLFGWHHLAIGIGLGVTAAIGLGLRKSPTFGRLLGGAALSALAFYFLSNLVSFAVDPLYPKSLLGFVQAQWTGPLGYGPTWMFLRNLLAANLLFSALFYLARTALPSSQPASSPVVAR